MYIRVANFSGSQYVKFQVKKCWFTIAQGHSHCMYVWLKGSVFLLLSRSTQVVLLNMPDLQFFSMKYASWQPCKVAHPKDDKVKGGLHVELAGGAVDGVQLLDWVG